MFMNKHLYLAVLSVNMVCCYCYVNYDLFRGFDPFTTDNVNSENEHEHINMITHKTTTAKNILVVSGKHNGVNSTISTARKRKIVNVSGDNSTSTDSIETINSHEQRKPKIKIKQFNKKCPETERPQNIGTFEIPTQKDLVLFTKRTLLKQFNSYHEKTLYLLKDIKEATKATVEVENKCHGRGKAEYKKCVTQVTKKCIFITKGLVASLERQRAEVAILTEDKICTMTSMRTDPIQLIKVLAMDEATLDFALPAFLRLLGGCTVHCHRSSLPDHRPRLRKLTDQDLVIRHLLTGKNYLQLLKDSNTSV